MRKITCIICPRGCSVDVDTKSLETSGNMCKRGAEYAIAECTAPVRTVTSTVKVSNRTDTRVCVKTLSPISKDTISEVMENIHSTSVSAPVRIGDVIIPDIFGTSVIATSDVE